jgi:SAM-dependent methyltransferase
MPWWYAVAERDHTIQNPTSEAKIRLLGERLRLAPSTTVLDIACGKAGPAVVLAREFGCRITGIERAPEFAEVARERVEAAGLAGRIEIVQQDAAELAFERERYDVTMCLGASFIWDGLPGTLAALRPPTRHGGYVVVGEPYWRRWPLPADVDDEGFVSLAETARRFGDGQLELVGLIAASEDDWDRYETLHWQAVDEWLADHSDDPAAADFRERNARYRDTYLRQQRELLGWAIFIGRKRTGSGRAS